MLARVASSNRHGGLSALPAQPEDTGTARTLLARGCGQHHTTDPLTLVPVTQTFSACWATAWSLGFPIFSRTLGLRLCQSVELQQAIVEQCHRIGANVSCHVCVEGSWMPLMGSKGWLD